MKTAIIGATGLVGQTLLRLLEERAFPIDDLIPVASGKSFGKSVKFLDKHFIVTGLEQALEAKPDVAFFSAGSGISREWAKKFAEEDILVIDNSSAWRMDPGIPLVVPEINGSSISEYDRLVANANCSTIQLLMAVHNLHRRFEIERMVVSTYQSVSGSGQTAIDQMEKERRGEMGEGVYPHPIDRNCLPHCGDFDEYGYTEEETKLERETAKILDPSIKLTATAVRVPVSGGHSEAVNIRFKKDFELAEVNDLLNQSRGVTLLDDPLNHTYPMPLIAHGKDDVFVGRVRRDRSESRSLNMWVVADNLRKGAATNAIQIAEYCLDQGLLKKE